ncbi:MAG: alpha-galactosidase [Clostridia bacterium]|nr:alpha-galactosidase [Clostridia bacterium]
MTTTSAVRLGASLAAALLSLALVSASPAGRAWAAQGVALTTPYPGVDAQAGQTVTFDLEVENGSGVGQTVGVSVVSTPAGWSTLLKAGTADYAVHEVYVAPGGRNGLTLQVHPAADAKPGDYEVTLAASSPGGTRLATLVLTVRIVEGGGEGPQLSTQYPSLEGSPSSTFEYSLDLENRSLTEETFHFSAEAPDGWKVTFQSGFGGKTISTDTVPAGGSDTITVDVDPPSDVKAGSYPIRVTADAGGGQSASVDLEAVVTGSVELTLSTPSGRLNADATAGHPSRVQLVLSNSGSADATGVTFYSDAPPNWKVDFSPSSVDVPAGGKAQVTATITPDAKAIAGDYQVTVTASATSDTASQDLRVTVNTSTLWGLVGVLVVVAVVAGLLYVFRVYGRR